MDYDLVIIGGGPAGLATAIRFKQLCNQYNKNYSVCLIEKGSEIGAHTISGAVFDPAPLNELIPNWRKLNPPIYTYAAQDQFKLLTEYSAIPLPVPPQMQNKGNYILSLGNLCRWLGEHAKELGVDIFTGFAATKICYDEKDNVVGVVTGDRGVDKNGKHKNNFQAGTKINSKQIILAEGARGSLTKEIIKKFQLDKECDPQTYALGLKEVWEVDPEQHDLGMVIHTVGWPLDNKTYGGSFIYHLENNRVAVGFAVGLDYKNPYLNPFQEFQRFKTHPTLRALFKNGKRLSYGARVINEGGFQSIPKLTFPGGVLVGCSAGFVNVPRVKGNHTAMKSGIVAAETIFDDFRHEEKNIEIKSYEKELKASWVFRELHEARNIRPAFRKGLWCGLIYSAIDTYILRGKAPWTFKQSADNLSLSQKYKVQEIDYPKPDGKISFDLPSSLFLSNISHEENQPCHLHLRDLDVPIDINLKRYGAPEQFYCPADVYEIIDEQLHINPANCLHCKACDIKDPTQNIEWTPPEGGSGPNYEGM